MSTASHQRQDSAQQRAEAACAGKHRFDSRSLAQQVASRQRHRHHGNGSDGRAQAYACGHCNGWHVGSHYRMPAKPRRERGGRER